MLSLFRRFKAKALLGGLAVLAQAPSGAMGGERVLILTENGGGGHIAAAKAVEDVLKSNGYETFTFKPLENLSMDKKFNDYFQDGQWHKLQLLTKLQVPLELIAPATPIKTALEDKIDEVHPKLIISVFPIANKMTQNIAKKRDIPMLVLPTDLESSHFFHNLLAPGPKFKIGLAFDDPALKKALKPHYFKPENYSITGFPLRPEFGIPTADLAEDIQSIRKEYGIAEKDRVAIIMMGARGAGTAVLDYAKAISNISINTNGRKLHVMALCGSNEGLFKNVSKIAKNKGKSSAEIHAIGFKDARFMASLMRIGNVLISKPGGSTTNEALASEIYTLFHKPEVLFKWEEGNMKYAQKLGGGEPIRKRDFAAQFTLAILRDRPKIPNCPGRDFGKNLLAEVHGLIGENNILGLGAVGATAVGVNQLSEASVDLGSVAVGVQN